MVRLSQEKIDKFCNGADSAFSSVQFAYPAYFQENPLALMEVHKFVVTIQPGESSILLQLLCAVPDEIQDIDTEPNLANGWVSLEGLTEEEWAYIKTALAFDKLFCTIFLEKIAVFNCYYCHQLLDLYRPGEDGCCAKREAEEECALIAM